MVADTDIWYVKHAGGEYEIMYSNDREYLQTKWWVLRKNDMRTSKRFYSFAAGAFLALSSGAIVWI